MSARTLSFCALLTLIFLLGCAATISTSSSANPSFEPTTASPPNSPQVTYVVAPRAENTQAAPAFDASPTPTLVVPSPVPSPIATEIIEAGKREAFVPILMYHHLANLAPNAALAMRTWTVAPANFVAQLDYLNAHEYHTITFAQLVAYLETGAPLPTRPIILSFDDGWEEQYVVAVPELRKRGMSGTFFVPTTYADYAGKTFMSWQQLVEMDAAGMEMGGHTLNHANFREVGLEQVTRQLVASKQKMEQKLGHSTVAFAYPFGAFNLETIARVRAAGYHAAVILCCGYRQRRDTMLTMPRIRISYDDSLEQFGKWLPPEQ